MTKRKVIISILLFLLYALAVWFGSSLLATGTTFFLVVFVLIALGLTVLIVYLLLSKFAARNAPAPAPAPTSDSAAPAPSAGPAANDPDLEAVSALMAEANTRLAQSPKLANRRTKTSVTNLPLYLLCGVEGCGKTTTFLKSGLEPELLAGQVFRETAILPTRLANFWFAENALFVEPSGALFNQDAGRWAGVLQRLQASSGGFLKKLFPGKSSQQLRGCVLFCDMSPFVGVPDPSRMSNLSRRIQERLRQVGESFGSNFPVYVVFTKADQLPFFNEYFSRLVDNEDQQILGCTLPVSAVRQAGEVFAEAETARLGESFNNLYYSLADKRLAMLPREVSARPKPAIYEFPREMKRIRDTLVQFLVDIARPNPLQPGPILRGFYFTGTREVSVSTLSAAPASTPAARTAAGEATSLFNLADYKKRIGIETQTGASPLETKVSRWCFVAELFHRVILADPLGASTAFANRRQDQFRRILFGGVAALSLILCILWMRSWWLNAQLLGDVEQASLAAYAFQPNVRAVPSIETLRGLEGLRQQLETLLTYDRDGAPWKMRWGLYAGSRALPSTYQLYFQRFRQLFFNDIHGVVSTTLVQLPSSPDAAHTYNSVYDQIKAYRMVTQGKCTPEKAFLTPVLADVWMAGRSVDPDRQALILKQLDFYAGELKQKNPYQVEEKSDAVERGRMYLSAFGGVERLYRGIIEEANKSPRRSANLAEIAPNYKVVLNSPGEVQAAFTREGWGFASRAMKDPSRMAVGEPCVMGGMGAATQLLQGGQIESDLQNLYIADYIRKWKDFVSKTSVEPFRSVADASRKLDALADNRSALLASIFLISDNTNFPAPSATAAAASSVATQAAGGLLDRMLPGAKQAVDAAKQVAAAKPPAATTADIVRVFQPAREVVPPESRDRLIADPNRAYMNALAELQRAMARLENDRPSNPDLALHEQARRAVDSGTDAVRTISQKFNIAGSEGVDTEVKRILEAPFKESLKYIITDPAKAGRDKASGAAKQFCARFAALERKFPFNPTSDNDASTDEVAAIFAPGTGALTALQQQLAKLIVKQGKIWLPNPESQDAHATQDFLRFMNRMQQIQDALFADGGAQVKMHYALRPLPGQNVQSITLDIDGQKITASGSAGQAKQVVSPAPGGGQVVVTVRAGSNIPFGSYGGPWAVFRWMGDADSRPPGSKTAQWSTLRQGRGQSQTPTDNDGKPIVMRIEISEFPAGVDVFDKSFFAVHCPGKVAE